MMMLQLENRLKMAYLQWIDQHDIPPTQAELCNILQLSAVEFEAYFGAVARLDTKIWQDIMQYTLYLTENHSNLSRQTAKGQLQILFAYLLEVLKKHQKFVCQSLQTHGLVDAFPKPVWLCVLDIKKQLEKWVDTHISSTIVPQHAALRGFTLPQLVGLQFGIMLEKFLEDNGEDDFLHTQAAFEGGLNFIFGNNID